VVVGNWLDVCGAWTEMARRSVKSATEISTISAAGCVSSTQPWQYAHHICWQVYHA